MEAPGKDPGDKEEVRKDLGLNKPMLCWQIAAHGQIQGSQHLAIRFTRKLWFCVSGLSLTAAVTSWERTVVREAVVHAA